MIMGHKVIIKHPCLQISTPADLKTLQWVWARNKVTAYKSPLYTNNDQELKAFNLKTLSEKIMSRGAYNMFDQKILHLNIEQSRSPEINIVGFKMNELKAVAQGSLLLHQTCYSLQGEFM